MRFIRMNEEGSYDAHGVLGETARTSFNPEKLYVSAIKTMTLKVDTKRKTIKTIVNPVSSLS